MLDLGQFRSSTTSVQGWRCGLLFAPLTCSIFLVPIAMAQHATSKCANGVTVRGIVLRPDGKPLGGAVVRLERKQFPDVGEMKTTAAGGFAFESVSSGNYRLTAEKSGVRSPTVDVTTLSGTCVEHVDLVLQADGASLGRSAGPAAKAMEFADEPDFTIAGVTDWTAVGGHGSDSTLRTSESLASEMLSLKPEKTSDGRESARHMESENLNDERKLRAAVGRDRNNFVANHQLGALYLHTLRAAEAIPLLETANKIDPSNEGNQYDLALAYDASGNISRARKCIHELLARYQSAKFYRLAGELDEKAHDALSAVHEFEHAARLDPSEQNYFEWGSELLLHRAIWQAQEVFQKGVYAYPKSVRMQTAMGVALFAGARYDDAALRLCQASELDPADSYPYVFIGKIQIAAPHSLTCVEPMLAHYVRQQPRSALANYIYAMSILKRLEQSPNHRAEEQAEALLAKSVSLDPKCSTAYLQLGVMAASRHSFRKAIGFYKKAIEADPQLADSYYRLGVAYDRTGQAAKAKQEFQLHDQIKQRQADTTEQQRRDVKQFLIILSGEHSDPVTSSH